MLRLQHSAQTNHILYISTGSLLFVLSGFLLLNLLHPFTINSASATSSIITTSYSNDGEYVSTPTVSGDIDLDLTGTSSGAYTGGSHTVSVDTNVDTYALYVSTTNADSAMVNTTNNTYTIPATSGTASSAATMSTNTWGYALDSFNPGSNAQTAYTYDTLAKGDGSTDQWNSSLWAKVPYVASADTDVSDADQIFEHTSSMPQNNNSTDIYYAVKANKSLAAGEYSATVVYTVVADVTPSVKYMQDFTTAECSALAEWDSSGSEGDTITLVDSRDNNEYYVRKLADGNCWMVQNLNLQGGTTVESIKSDVSSNYILPASSTSGFSDDNIAYVYNDNNNANYGGYYSWRTATADTGVNIASGNNAPSSICPKRWKLPLGTTNNYSWYYLGKQYGFSQDVYSADIYTDNFRVATNTGSDYLGGQYNYSQLMNNQKEGIWWSRTAYDKSFAYDLYVTVKKILTQNYNYGPGRVGNSVRCVLSSE